MLHTFSWLASIELLQPDRWEEVSMSNGSNGYGLTVFKPGTPPQVRSRGIFFFILFCVIILVQCCYFLFANSVEPILLGMPFGMFFVVLFVAIEFAALLALFKLEENDPKE
jgi:hypothetical protein